MAQPPVFQPPPASLAGLQRIRQWHVAHRAQHPLEYQLLDAVLTAWIMGWTGWVAVIALDASWAIPLCLLGMAAPRLYIAWRARAHRSGRLRCDWLDLPD